MTFQPLDYAESGERRESYYQLVVVLKRNGESDRVRSLMNARLGIGKEASDLGFRATCRHLNVSIHGKQQWTLDG